MLTSIGREFCPAKGMVIKMKLKEKVEKRLNIIGTHVNLIDANITEIFGKLGYDFIWVDLEHTRISMDSLYEHILAARSTGTPVVVRVPADDLTVTKRTLEMGVDGIVFPMVRDAEHAEKLLSWTLYPPYGARGCGPKGAVSYGMDSEKEYYGKGHLEMCRFVQIELRSAAEDAERIAALPYLDGCVLGMHDLSGSIGRLGDIFCEENLALAEHAIKAFSAREKSVGVSTFATDAATLGKYKEMGINMISTGADYEYIIRGARATLDIMKNEVRF